MPAVAGGARLTGLAGADARPGASRSGVRPAIASIALWHEAAAAGADGRPRHRIGKFPVWGPTACKSVPKVS
ncbi:conserved hypothetical protein [Burkholderia orbicola]